MFLHKAIVKFFKFNPEDRKNFGFAYLENGSDVYFHGTRLVDPICDGGDTPTGSGRIANRQPERDDEIMLDFTKTEKGLAATQWCFKADYDKVIQQIAARKQYRLMKQYGPAWIGKLMPFGYENPTQLWQGKDIRALRKQYPQSIVKIVDMENYRTWFEVMEDGTWWLCEYDPRNQ